jgi:hypothetical protein
MRTTALLMQQQIEKMLGSSTLGFCPCLGSNKAATNDLNPDLKYLSDGPWI